MIAWSLFLSLALWSFCARAEQDFASLRTLLGLSQTQIDELKRIESSPGAAQRRFGIIPPPPPGTLLVGDSNFRDWSGAPMQQRKEEYAQSVRARVLTPEQAAKLMDSAKVLAKPDLAGLTISLGLLKPNEWPGQTLCPYPVRSNFTELSLTDAQLQGFWQLERIARASIEQELAQKVSLRQQGVASGVDGAAIALQDLQREIQTLQARLHAVKPPSEQVMAMLDDRQRAEVSTFRTSLSAVSEAITLGLIAQPMRGEVLCH